MAETLLISGLTSLGLMLGYAIVKRVRRSKCAMDACGCKIDSLPEQIELQKKETTRLESIIAELVTRTEHLSETKSSEVPNPRDI